MENNNKTWCKQAVCLDLVHIFMYVMRWYYSEDSYVMRWYYSEDIVERWSKMSALWLTKPFYENIYITETETTICSSVRVQVQVQRQSRKVRIKQYTCLLFKIVGDSNYPELNATISVSDSWSVVPLTSADHWSCFRIFPWLGFWM